MSEYSLYQRASIIPRTARVVRMRTWGGGRGTFWQHGDIIGVEWEVLPDWGEEMNVGVRSKSWFCPEPTARRWIELLARHAKIEYHKLS